MHENRQILPVFLAFGAAITNNSGISICII